MTTAAAQPPPPPPARVPTPGPRPNHSRTSSLQSESTAPPKTRPNQSSVLTENVAQSQQPGGARRGGRAASADPLSDKTTAFLIRRILCPQQADKGRTSPASIEGLLPPLTSRNDMDLQLYALIAIILREFVQNWYAKITPDETFVAEIVQIIAHITRALEQRLRKVDLESLLFDELPDLLDKHVTAYRVAHDPIAQPPVRTDPRDIYHSLCPLPALSPVPRPEDPESVAVQAENEAAYRQLLVHAFLAILLPTEDLENGCLTALVGQIFSELIIGNAVANRLSEPWLIWELLIIASRTAGRQKTTEAKDRLGQSSNPSSDAKRRFSVHALFWAVLQWCFLAISFIRTAFAILVTSASLPPRTSHGAGTKGATRHETGQGPIRLTSSLDADLHPPRTPVLAFRCWSAVSNLAEMDVRMPWLRGALSMLQWIAAMGPGRIASVDGRLDRLLSYGIQRHVLDAANLPPLLRTVRGAMFPNNMPAGKPTLVAPSSDAELRALRRRCASALWALVPKGVGRLYFGGGLLRANPVSRASSDKTEGSAELKTAGVVRKLDSSSSSHRDMGRDKGPWPSSSPSASASSTTEGGEEANVIRKGEEKARRQRIETETAPPAAQTTTTTTHAAAAAATSARGQERSRAAESGSGSSQSRSRRSAPAPRPKTGGQQGGPLPPAAASATAAADVSADPSSKTTANANVSASAAGENNDDYDDDDGEILDEIERGILDVFSDAYCNKHLVYGVLELVLVRLLPELTEKGVLELWGERVSVEG